MHTVHMYFYEYVYVYLCVLLLKCVYIFMYEHTLTYYRHILISLTVIINVIKESCLQVITLPYWLTTLYDTHFCNLQHKWMTFM